MQSGYRAKRLRQAAIAVLVTGGVFVISELPAQARLITAGSGLFFGAAIGAWHWLRLSSRIDVRRTLVIYFTDSPFYLLLFIAGVLSFVPRSLIGIGRFALLNPGSVAIALVALAFAWLGYDVMLWRRIARFEAANGNINTRYFYAPSMTGSEGMLGQSGIVDRQCAPNGWVRVAGERWQAQSIDHHVIEPGQRVVVRDINGLVLIVETTPDDAANRNDAYEKYS